MDVNVFFNSVLKNMKKKDIDRKFTEAQIQIAVNNFKKNQEISKLNKSIELAQKRLMQIKKSTKSVKNQLENFIKKI